MFTRLIIIAAVVAYALAAISAVARHGVNPPAGGEPSVASGLPLASNAAFAASVVPVADSPPEPVTPSDPSGPADLTIDPLGLPYRGAGMQVQRMDWMDRYKQSIDEIAAAGGDTVLLVVDMRQENGLSSRIYLDVRITPTSEQLGGLILHARSQGLRTIVMPIVLLDKPRGTEWRGTIKPSDWDQWWESYRGVILHLSHICQGYGANVLVVGSELVSTEHMHAEWSRLIKEVRQAFNGKLTYSANWDHYLTVPFWNELDLIGMNSYWKMGPDRSVSVDRIVGRWGEIQKDVLAFQRQVGKPLVLLEVGWCSLENAAHQPWDYTKQTEAIDLDLQRRLYEGFFRAWYGNPSLGGFLIWEWPPGDGGTTDRGYTPEGKPAEQELRRWLAEPRWKVGGL